jgi:hypothetical protein
MIKWTCTRKIDNPDLVDNSGYLGLFYREKKQLLPITEEEVIDIIHKNNKLHIIFRIIKDIDSRAIMDM